MRLKAFGGLAITIGGDRTEEPRLQRRQLALLAALAAEAPAGLTRDRLLGLFWPDKNSDKARHALDQLLYGIRRALGAEVLRSGPANLAVNAAVLPSDAAEFIAALARGDHEAAAAVYTGPFLDGVHLSDAPEFERWAESRRSYFGGAAVDALTRLATRASRAGEYASAAGYLRRAAANDPLSGTVAHSLMLALAHGGDVSAALEAARVHVTMVRQELDAEPDAAVAELIARLQAGTPLSPPVAPAVTVTPASKASEAPTILVDIGAREAGTSTLRSGKLGIATLGLAVVTLLAILVARMEGRPRHTLMAVLRDRAQITTSGRIRAPALSADGKYVAYIATDCGATGCDRSVEIQEAGGTVTRRVVEGARTLDYVKWSPDGRHLLVAGTVPSPNGDFSGFAIVSALGGPAAPLCICTGAFFAGGDSLLLAPDPRPDSVFWARVATLDGVVRDSIRVAGPGEGINFALNIPGTSWFALDMRRYPLASELRIIDRAGRESDRLELPWIGVFQASADAVWISLDEALIRIPFDSKTGRLGTVRDTVYTGVFTGFDVTADGSQIVLDEGTEDFDLWGLELRDALRGDFSPARRLLHRSAHIAITMAPDGKRVMVAHWDGPAAALRAQLSIIPFGGGGESPLPLRGSPGSWTWVDSVTLAITMHEPDGSHFALVDTRTGAQRADFAPRDTGLRCCALPLSGSGWAWIPADGRSIRAQNPGESQPRVFERPAWFNDLSWPTSSPDGQRILYAGLNQRGDSVRVDVLSLRDSAVTPWLTIPAPQDLEPNWLADGSVLLAVSESQERWTLYRLPAPGRVETLGTIPRPVWAVQVSADLRRAAISTRDYRGDAWMYRVEGR
jgi:DNA-binding SARP family transcriptional activator